MSLAPSSVLVIEPGVLDVEPWAELRRERSCVESGVRSWLWRLNTNAEAPARQYPGAATTTYPRRV